MAFSLPLTTFTSSPPMSVSETAFIADIVDEFRAYRRSTDARIAALERAVREAQAQLSASSHAHQAQKEDVDEEGEGGLISAYGRRGGGLELELLGDNQDLIKGKGVIAATRVALGDASSSSSQARASSSSTGPPIPHTPPSKHRGNVTATPLHAILQLCEKRDLASVSLACVAFLRLAALPLYKSMMSQTEREIKALFRTRGKAALLLVLKQGRRPLLRMTSG